MPNELQSSKKPGTKLRGAKRDLIPNFLSHKHGCQHLCGGEPLRGDASIRDFNGGIGCHIASAIEEALLLPKDMAEIKNVRKNELILDNKRYLGMVRNWVLSSFLLR